MTITLRKSKIIDIPFLRKMLYEAAFWRIGVDKPTFEEGLARPDIGKILADWGKRDGDTAVIASVNSIPVGAAWYRFWNYANFSYGYVDENTPELGIGVLSDYRNQGIGKKMMRWLIDYASNHSIQAISLSVSKENYAKTLYLQQGFQEYEDVGKAFTMIHRFKIGIGTPLARRPSHTTGHTDPYPAVRLVKTGTDKTHPACRALLKQNATDISASAAIYR